MKKSDSIIPVAVFGFNRPDSLKRVLAALKAQKIDHLMVFIDGPLKNEDYERVEQCRTIAKDVDWVEKDLHFHEQNRGLPGIANDLDTVFRVHKAAVILEDDCLPMPGFYKFMVRALEHYEFERKVFAIGGYQPLNSKHFQREPGSIMSTWRFICWGWASWKDRWEALRPPRLQFAELFQNLSKVPDIAGDDLGSAARVVVKGQVKSWAIQVSIAMLWLGQVMLLPKKGLIENIGIGGGSHGKGDYHPFHNRNANRSYPLEELGWLENIEPRHEHVIALNRHITRILKPGLSVRIIKKLVHYRLKLMQIWNKFINTQGGPKCS